MSIRKKEQPAEQAPDKLTLEQKIANLHQLHAVYTQQAKEASQMALKCQGAIDVLQEMLAEEQGEVEVEE